MRESCGVFGANVGPKEVFPYLYWGMLAQNHRGHQSHGFAVYNDSIEVHRELGLRHLVLSDTNGEPDV